MICREQAEGIRVAASLLNDGDAKARMLRIAERYEAGAGTASAKR